MQKREKVYLKSDGKCCECGHELHLDKSRPYDNFYVQMDHIVPRAVGGSNDVSNLQAMCKSCNSKKGARSSSRLIAILAKSFEQARLIQSERDIRLEEDLKVGTLTSEDLEKVKKMNALLYEENLKVIERLEGLIK